MAQEHLQGTASQVIADPEDQRDVLWAPADPDAPLPPAVGYEEYRRYVGETWHQRGQECTGFALAALANYTIRKRLGNPEYPSVSRRMLYEMAQFYDGETYVEGSTLRGALKGWRRVGVTRDDLWPYVPGDEEGAVQGRLTLARLLDARSRRLLRYARIPNGQLATMRQALAQGHALYACARYHVGWFRLYLPGRPPVIERRSGDAIKGGHAFVIAGYDERGFWIHNSFGAGWGQDGYAVLPYADWEAHGQDAWVIDAEALESEHLALEPERRTIEETEALRRLWPHLVVLRDDGLLASNGPYEMDAGSVGTMLYLFQEHTRTWTRRRLAIFADGGYRPTAWTIRRMRALCENLLAQEIYPIFVVWETSWWAQLQHEIDTWMTRLKVPAGRAPGDADARKALKRTIIESLWGKLIERSGDACRAKAGGARLLAESVAYKRSQIPFDLHLVSHGVGDLLLAELTGMMPGPVTSATALAPATTFAHFGSTYAQHLRGGQLAHMTVFALSEDAEQADRTGPLTGSLLNLVSEVLAGVDVEVADRAGEAGVHPAATAHPLIGLARDLNGDAEDFLAPWKGSGLDTILVPQGTHVDLLFDEALHAQILQRMLDRQSPDAIALPRDPLARATALARAAAGAQAPSR